jgi:hypothetical protein
MVKWPLPRRRVAVSLGFVVPEPTRGDRPKQFGKEKAVAFVADFASLG